MIVFIPQIFVTYQFLIFILESFGVNIFTIVYRDGQEKKRGLLIKNILIKKITTASTTVIINFLCFFIPKNDYLIK